jgi:hypothetical protein
VRGKQHTGNKGVGLYSNSSRSNGDAKSLGGLVHVFTPDAAIRAHLQRALKAEGTLGLTKARAVAPAFVAAAGGALGADR